MAIATGLAVAGMAMSVGMSAYTAVKANQEEKDARIKKEAEEARLEDQRNSRQQIYNPMAGLTNEAEKIGVATKAAEFQAEQADLALANTLDTIMATGSGGAGATALAQAALQSKQGVAASIEQQEAANEKLRAQGQQQLEQLQMQEGIRVQNVQIGEGQRMQQADAMGRQFMFNAQEKRQDDKIRYTRGEIAGAQQREQQAYNQQTKAMQSVIGGIAGIGAVGAAGGFKKSPSPDEIAAISKLI